MNFATLVSRVRLTLGMSEAVANDESVLIKGWINEGIVDILVRTRPYTRHIDLTVLANTPEHDLASLVLALVDVFDAEGNQLRRMTRGDILRAQKVGKAGFAYEEPLFWYSPIVSVDTHIVAYGIMRPTSLVNDADDPSSPGSGGLGAEFHPFILNYALWKAGEYVQHQDSGAGEKWRIMYEGQDGEGGDIARMKRILNKRVTPQYARRPNLDRNLGTLSVSGDYLGG
jgi:hypothetical protein